MHLAFLLEERSMEAALSELVPKIRPDVGFTLHPYQGKPDLIGKLPARLRGYARIAMMDHRVVVVVDRDRDDCLALKKKLVDIATAARVPALVRIVIEELEAWFLGDVTALRAAYPRVPSSLAAKAQFRDPDSVAGGTAEALEHVLKRAGYYPTGMPKVEVATKVASAMDPEINRSKSFQVFRDGLRALE